MRKSKGGIGGKFMNDTSDGEPQDAPSSSETDARKLEAGKLLLRAIKADDPQLTAEAVATLAECASESGDDAGSEDDTEA
jgi:flagellar basal body P-ring protein FlgI